jgi:hypothetical protein
MGDLGRRPPHPGSPPRFGGALKFLEGGAAGPGSPRALNPRKRVRDRDHRPAGGGAEGGPALPDRGEPPALPPGFSAERYSEASGGKHAGHRDPAHGPCARQTMVPRAGNLVSAGRPQIPTGVGHRPHPESAVGETSPNSAPIDGRHADSGQVAEHRATRRGDGTADPLPRCPLEPGGHEFKPPSTRRSIPPPGTSRAHPPSMSKPAALPAARVTPGRWRAGQPNSWAAILAPPGNNHPCWRSTSVPK